MRPLVCEVSLGGMLASSLSRSWGTQKLRRLAELERHVVVVQISDPGVRQASAKLSTLAQSSGWSLFHGKNDLGRCGGTRRRRATLDDGHGLPTATRTDWLADHSSERQDRTCSPVSLRPVAASSPTLVALRVGLHVGRSKGLDAPIEVAQDFWFGAVPRLMIVMQCEDQAALVRPDVRPRLAGPFRSPLTARTRRSDCGDPARLSHRRRASGSTDRGVNPRGVTDRTGTRSRGPCRASARDSRTRRVPLRCGSCAGRRAIGPGRGGRRQGPEGRRAGLDRLRRGGGDDRPRPPGQRRSRRQTAVGSRRQLLRSWHSHTRAKQLSVGCVNHPLQSRCWRDRILVAGIGAFADLPSN
jgi:hypothetical protein